MLPLSRTLIHRLGLKPLRVGKVALICRPFPGIQWSLANLLNFKKKTIPSSPEVSAFAGAEKSEKHEQDVKTNAVNEKRVDDKAKTESTQEQDHKDKSGQKEKKKKKKKKTTKNEKKEPATKSKLKNTPLDLFFLSFPTYQHNPSLRPDASFKRLQKHFQWSDESAKQKAAWARYRVAIKKEIEIWHGNDKDLTACHSLCRAIRDQNPPQKVGKCQKLLSETHVNIADLIEWAETCSKSSESVKVFPTVEALARYSLEAPKIYSLKKLQINGRKDIALRHLLRYILKHRGICKSSE